jgi:hypothetical protein
MKRILVIESDETYAQRLLTLLKITAQYGVSMVKTMREAALLLAQQPHDLALAPMSDGDNLVRSLRAVQANLRIVLTTPRANIPPPTELPADIQGVLLMPLLEVDLLGLVRDALSQEVKPTAAIIEPEGIGLDVALLEEILKTSSWAEPVQAVLLSYQAKRLASWGVLAKPELSALASQVDHDWHLEPRLPQDVQIQFWGGDAGVSNPFIVYTRPTVHGLLLSIVAVSQLTITELRLQADAVAEKLAARLPSPALAEAMADLHLAEEPVNAALAVAETAAKPAATFVASSGKTYTTIWRTLSPLPETMLERLELIFHEIAEDNGCLIKQKLLRPDLVHLVVACPPGRNSVWLVHLLKQQSETRLAADPEQEAGLWARGYYATESSSLLSDSEIQLFLDRERVS